MKQLILLSLSIGLFISACDSPLGNFKSEQTGNSVSADLPKVTYSLETVQADTIRKAAWEQFRAQNGEKWRVNWDEHTGLTIRCFYGAL
jgi:hypothetical protein